MSSDCFFLLSEKGTPMQNLDLSLGNEISEFHYLKI